MGRFEFLPSTRWSCCFRNTWIKGSVTKWLDYYLFNIWPFTADWLVISWRKYCNLILESAFDVLINFELDCIFICISNGAASISFNGPFTASHSLIFKHFVHNCRLHNRIQTQIGRVEGDGRWPLDHHHLYGPLCSIVLLWSWNDNTYNGDTDLSFNTLNFINVWMSHSI